MSNPGLRPEELNALLAGLRLLQLYRNGDLDVRNGLVAKKIDEICGASGHALTIEGIDDLFEGIRSSGEEQ